MLSFFYYSGMVFCGLKQLSKAVQMFSAVSATCTVHAALLLATDRCPRTDCLLPLVLPQVICAPADAISAVTVEAHKKYILTSLLTSGNVPRFPEVCRQLVPTASKSASFTRTALMTVCTAPSLLCSMWLLLSRAPCRRTAGSIR